MCLKCYFRLKKEDIRNILVRARSEILTFFLISSPVIINPFIGIVGTANVDVRFGIEGWLLFRVIGLLMLESVGAGRDGFTCVGVEILWGCKILKRHRVECKTMLNITMPFLFQFL